MLLAVEHFEVRLPLIPESAYLISGFKVLKRNPLLVGSPHDPHTSVSQTATFPYALFALLVAGVYSSCPFFSLSVFSFSLSRFYPHSTIISMPHLVFNRGFVRESTSSVLFFLSIKVLLRMCSGISFLFIQFPFFYHWSPIHNCLPFPGPRKMSWQSVPLSNFSLETRTLECQGYSYVFSIMINQC